MSSCRRCADPDGPEVDWVLTAEDRWLPVEVNWGEAPSALAAAHLEVFLGEYPKAKEGIVVCRTPKPFKLCAKITAMPWQGIPNLVERIA